MPTDELAESLRLPEEEDDDVDDALSRVLLRIMRTDPDSNMVFGNTNKGDAEDRAAALTYAMHTGSSVILDYENHLNMAKRAEGGHLFTKILETIKHIGKREEGGAPGFFGKLRGNQ